MMVEGTRSKVRAARRVQVETREATLLIGGGVIVTPGTSRLTLQG